ncbi:MAG: 2,3-bisphosphoglycerate-independent phosphoglycerate mutase [Bacillota bacterium]
MVKSPQTVVLMILDGFGLKNGKPGDALSGADLSNFDYLWQNYPHTKLEASGLAVGLPEGQMGNSEVGHMNIGAGRIIYQDITRINRLIADGEFYKNPVFLQTMSKLKKSEGALHLFGLCSDGGIHSHVDHLFALLRMAKKQGLTEVYVHCFMDGRDSSPTSGLGYIEQVEKFLATLGIGEIATVMGRFYAMDRDNRWERVQRAYQTLVYGEGKKYATAAAAVKASYAVEVTDEFIEPAVIVDDEGLFKGAVKSGDAVIFYNFRTDRARELSAAFCRDDFTGFERGEKRPQVDYVCMTRYEEGLPAAVAYAPEMPQQTLGQVISQQGLRQLRIAETEKYAHVTFFFNGGTESIVEGEERILIPSPKVATYDLQPQMSCPEITKIVVEQIKTNDYALIVLNFANPDMLGHTGNFAATVAGLNVVDQAVGQVLKAVQDSQGILLLTADHGNAEMMLDEKGEPMTAHTTSRVPFILINDSLKKVRLREGKLSDIAPTILQLLHLEQPQEMTGQTLIEGNI